MYTERLHLNPKMQIMSDDAKDLRLSGISRGYLKIDD
jgi:hypothetical protein